MSVWWIKCCTEKKCDFPCYGVLFIGVPKTRPISRRSDPIGGVIGPTKGTLIGIFDPRG